MPPIRRLNEADANFVVMGAATGAPYVPVSISVYEGPYQDPGTSEYLNEVMSRLLPARRQRIARDRLSMALPRWEDVPGFETSDHIVVLPAPGDGTLRSVIDWAQEWSRIDLPLDRPPWRSVTFEGVTVDGVAGRSVTVSQFHHALIDGMGASRLAEHYYQWSPDGSLPEMPPPVAPDTSTPGERWRQGWASERDKAKVLAERTASRLRWAAANPSAGAARARALASALKRLADAQGTETLSPLLRRRSQANRFDHLHVDLDRLRAGARAHGGSANDGLMAAVSLGLQRYHTDRGIKVSEVRAVMAISTRTEDAGHTGNELVAAIFELPLLDEAATALETCHELSRRQRNDTDVLWLIDRIRAAGNRIPKSIISRLFARGAKGIDVSLSNVKGMPLRNWVGGVEVLQSIPFLIGGPAVAVTMISGARGATLGVVTDPEAIADPERLMSRFAEGFAEVSALAG